MNNIVTAVNCDTLTFNKNLIIFWCVDCVHCTPVAISRNTFGLSAALVASVSGASVSVRRSCGGDDSCSANRCSDVFIRLMSYCS